MADRKFEFQIAATDANFSQTMDRIGTEARTAGAAVSQSFKRAAVEAGNTEAVFGRIKTTLAGAFTAGAVVQFGRAIAREAMDAEREVALLNATLRSTGFSAGLSANQINDLANEISRATSIDAGDILQGTTALLRFREVGGDTFREVSRLAVDLAVATGTAVPEAFAKVGRAVQDPVNGARALRDVGVKLSESQAELAKSLKATGDEAGAQRIILDELAKSVGGSGAAANTGLTGATNSLRNSWNDLLATIGQMPTVARASQESISSLSNILSLFNRALTADPVPGNISGTIAIPGVTKPGGKIGQLSAQEVQALQEASKRAGTKDFRIATTPSVAAAAAGGGGGSAGNGQTNIANLGAQMVLDQINELKRQSDLIRGEANRTRQELEQEVIRGIGVGPEIAAKQQKEFEDIAAKLVADTPLGRERAIVGQGGELDSLNTALIKGKISAEEYEQAFQGVQERLNAVRGVGKETFQSVSDEGKKAFQALEFAVQGWGRQFTDQFVEMAKTGKFNFSTLVDSILTDIARLVVQQTITKPIFDAIAAGLGSGLGGLFTRGTTRAPTAGIGPGAGQGLQIKGYAAGGSYPGGMPMIVGERGPELMLPRSSGTIIPNDAWALGGGGTTINMPLTVNVDARSDIATVRAAVAGAADLALARMQRASRGRTT